jgi:glycosyltransferase involved in cell wall biosynthesis
MTIFLNFAPFDFMGGSEKWMSETAMKVNKKEQTVLIDVSPSIANIYGELILKRKFKSHLDKITESKLPPRISLKFSNFVPFTKDWKNTVNTFKNARIVYARFEIPEILICIYFGGFKLFKKTIAGIILSPFYATPNGFVQKLHNFLYNSSLYKQLLKNTKRVHVLNKRDEIYMANKFKLNNLIYIPLGTDLNHVANKISKSKDGKLQIIVVGELSLRKGTDTLCDIIKSSPKELVFHIIGDGPMKQQIVTLAEKYENCIYYGFVSNEKLLDVYKRCDVILFPSRAEAFGLVMIEASSKGLKIVNSKEVSLSLPTYIETSIEKREVDLYVRTLTDILKEKNENKIGVDEIKHYTYNHFSNSVIDPLFMRKIIEL